MNDWIDRLEGYTKGLFRRAKKVSLLEKIDLEKYPQIILFRSPEGEKVELTADGCTRINLQKLTPEEYEEVKSYTKDSLENEHTTILEVNSEILREDFQETERGNTEILGLFKGRISTQDYNSLRMSLYVRSQYRRENKGLGDRYRSEIRKIYGERGCNICKLCTAGYLESHLIPLVELVDDPSEKFTNDDFATMYEIIVAETAFSVFISNTMSEEDALIAIKTQLERNQQYGVKELAIHGIGKHNIDKINKALNLIESEKEPLDKKVLQKKNVMTIKYLFE